MKKDIHPKYYPEARIICACGNIIITGSTRPEMKVEVCSACHPFYTGKKRLVDTTGQVDRFKKRFQKTEKIKAEKKRKSRKKPRPQKFPQKKPKRSRELRRRKSKNP
jgi:large subunit ribosomal protein L31